MSDEYGREEGYGREGGRHHHQKRDEHEYGSEERREEGGYGNRPPRRESEYGSEDPPRRESEYGSEDPPRRQSGYGGDEGGYGGRSSEGGEYGSEEAGRGRGGRRPISETTEYTQTFETDESGYKKPVAETAKYEQTYEDADGLASSRVEVTRHSREEKVAGFGALAAGAAALYENYEAKHDTENSGRHKIAAEVLGATAVGAAGFGVYEHHRKEKSEDEVENYEDKLSGDTDNEEKKHGWFG